MVDGLKSAKELRLEDPGADLKSRKRHVKKHGFDYSIRDKILKDMGFHSYYSYLKSDLWKSIRKTVLDRDGYQCTCCGKQAECVHHVRYDSDTLSGRTIKWLKSLCNKCHKKIECTKKGKKLSYNESLSRYNKLSK
jgi:hypothetical protein